MYEYSDSSPGILTDPSGEVPVVPILCVGACLGGIGCVGPCLSVCGADPQCLLDCYGMMSTYGQLICGGSVLGCAACICAQAKAACAAPLLLCIKNPRKCFPKFPKKPKPPTKPRKREYYCPPKVVVHQCNTWVDPSTGETGDYAKTMTCDLVGPSLRNHPRHCTYSCPDGTSRFQASTLL